MLHLGRFKLTFTIESERLDIETMDLPRRPSGARNALGTLADISQVCGFPGLPVLITAAIALITCTHVGPESAVGVEYSPSDYFGYTPQAAYAYDSSDYFGYTPSSNYGSSYDSGDYGSHL